ncbi:hypothetical protein Rumeso_03393 [Rubellimicrobium mesophilum DSM 19309]|uniref:Uncharacterized protein n=1 Tax=Rubellimicrobium mesophilum DSM 19309 TaxID=442562 RepID=A0A017HL90_9RHOB|nr:hypothetical protein [Rubellimicrobium mesophilum]EYD75065.1 hypothetical protein Rumeso_03393 [Rubellimicrobium mesophilum DSM 19309]
MKLGPARKNAIFGYVNFITAALIALVTSPLLVSFLGPAAFGHWKALQRIMEVAASLDGKPAQALKSIIAGRLHDARPEDRQRAIGSAAMVWLLWSPVVILLLALAIATFPVTIKDVSAADSLQVYVAGACSR